MSVPTITTTVTAKYLRAGDVIRWGNHMQVTLTDVVSHEHHIVGGCTHLTGTDREGRVWTKPVPASEMVETIDLEEMDARFVECVRRLPGNRR